MIKKDLNQNDIYVHELIDTIEPNFVFNDKPINRFKITEDKKNNLSREETAILQAIPCEMTACSESSTVSGLSKTLTGATISPFRFLLRASSADLLRKS